METNNEEAPTAHGQYQAFAGHLAALKQRGCALLVVGDLTPDQYRHACHQMLGDERAGPRRRVLVTAGESAIPPDARLPPTMGQPAAETTAHITYPTDTRSAAVASAAPSGGLPTKTVETADLSRLGITISAAIQEFEQYTGDFDAGELRVCVDSLRPLLEMHESKQVFQFLHLLVGRVQAVQGMAHFHLPVARDRKAVRLLAPVCDAVVELRSTGDTLQQRWQFTANEFRSSWLDV